MTPSLYRIIVCTATDENIWDESDALEHNIFKKSRCISNSYDFTQIDKIKSSSDNYSSISDAILITYEKRLDSTRNYKFFLRNNRFEIEDLLGETMEEFLSKKISKKYKFIKEVELKKWDLIRNIILKIKQGRELEIIVNTRNLNR